MKLYLDTCSLHRPFDDFDQRRVALEAEAINAVLALCESGDAELVRSEVLLLETARCRHPQRKAHVEEVLAGASATVTIDESVRRRARILEERGFRPFDSVHLASAEAAGADYFCTCDDRLLKKARSQTDLSVQIVSPLELVERIIP